jgi:hypothetical protein
MVRPQPDICLRAALSSGLVHLVDDEPYLRSCFSESSGSPSAMMTAGSDDPMFPALKGRVPEHRQKPFDRDERFSLPGELFVERGCD